MVEDVEIAVKGQAQVYFYGRPGGVIPTPDEVAHQISHYYHSAHLSMGDAGQARQAGGAA